MLESFRKNLLRWHDTHHRPLPWKGEKDAYKIWLSEVILQQTRVEQGLPYYQNFVQHYPTVHHLAAAPEDEVLKLWQGLGYYSRARNLLTTAKIIVNEYDGVFPESYEEILKLKGIGEYTAAAIASFAYGAPFAVVDGNVYRVLSRFFGIKTPVDTSEGKREFARLADNLLDKEEPGKYNQAIMDFGAEHCKPKNPLCIGCFGKEKCAAFQQKAVEQYPVKLKKLKKRTRYFNYFFIADDVHVLLNKRDKKDIWQNLYDLPMIETEKPLSENQIVQHEGLDQIFRHKNINFLNRKTYSQTLTHQQIKACFWKIEPEKSVENNSNFIKVVKKNLHTFAFPKVVKIYLEENQLI